jgi:hypothetical protein
MASLENAILSHVAAKPHGSLPRRARIDLNRRLNDTTSSIVAMDGVMKRNQALARAVSTIFRNSSAWKSLLKPARIFPCML